MVRDLRRHWMKKGEDGFMQKMSESKQAEDPLLFLAQGNKNRQSHRSYSEASSEHLDAIQNSEMPADHALSQLHTSVEPLIVCRIFLPSSHLVPHSTYEVEDTGYYPHFTGEETRAQGGQVLTWPRSHTELPYSRVCLNFSDFRSKALCSMQEGVGLPPCLGVGWALSSQRDPRRLQSTQQLPLSHEFDNVSLWCCIGKHY